MEQYIQSQNPQVTGALVVGAQRSNAGLLVEVKKDGKTTFSPAEIGALIEEIWPSVEEANRVSPVHARVDKSRILFTSPEKPMLRAGKGTIQRAGTLQAYEEEIARLYEANALTTPI